MVARGSIIAIALYCLLTFTLPASAWNSPAHMMRGAIVHQILQREQPPTITSAANLLKQHPWYAERWHDQIASQPEPQQTELLFMFAATWADEIRRQGTNRSAWHYINWPFKPEGEPNSVRVREPAKENILTGWAESERLVKTAPTAAERAMALAWLFHLAGDIHQPLHTVQLFTTEYPDGDRGGNEICIRPAENRRPINLHALWDGLITSSTNINRLRKEARRLANRPELGRRNLEELAAGDFQTWGKESFDIAVKIAYQNGAIRGTPKGRHRDCGDVADAAIIPPYYATTAGGIADRRIVLAGYRLADVLNRIFAN
jgi:S1/P1 Nuclease